MAHHNYIYECIPGATGFKIRFMHEDGKYTVTLFTPQNKEAWTEEHPSHSSGKARFLSLKKIYSERPPFGEEQSF